MILNAFNINPDISANYGQLIRTYFGREGRLILVVVVGRGGHIILK